MSLCRGLLEANVKATKLLNYKIPIKKYLPILTDNRVGFATCFVFYTAT